MQLKVIKADGSIEEYLHTKIIGTLSNALFVSGHESSFVAEQLAEAITYYLYNNNSGGTISSSEIYSIIQAMLSTTGYEDAALVLNNYHFTRELMRHRIEVVDAQGGNAWNKSQIVSDLVGRSGMESGTSRTIASMVEEKVLRLGMTKVPKSLIRELVKIETKAMLKAKEQLAESCGKNRKRTVTRYIDMEVSLEQEQKGVCGVAV